MATALDVSSGHLLTLSTESESSSITGRIPQKGSPRSTNRCANSWRNPTARVTEGFDGGEAHETFEMATTCEGQCIIDEEFWVINEERIDSKEPRLKSLLQVIAHSTRSMGYELSESRIHIPVRHPLHIATFLLTSSFFTLTDHKHIRTR